MGTPGQAVALVANGNYWGAVDVAAAVAVMEKKWRRKESMGRRKDMRTSCHYLVAEQRYADTK